MLPAGLRITVAAPHPDDFDAMGVTMRWLHAAGHFITLAVLTRGHSGVPDGFAGARTPDDKGAVREAEQRASLEYFGLPEARVRFLRLQEGTDGKLDTGAANARTVRTWLVQAAPRIVFLPHGNDSNITHQRTHALVTRVLGSIGATVLVCLSEDPKTISLRRDLLMPFGESDGAWKAGLLRCHRSQQERNRLDRGAGLDDRILGMNRNAARVVASDAPYVEAFELAWFRPGGIP